MSVAAPKRQARNPIDLDVILVCRKRDTPGPDAVDASSLLAEVRQAALEQVARFNAVGRHLGRNDVRVIVLAQAARHLSRQISVPDSLQRLDSLQGSLDALAARIHEGQAASTNARNGGASQLSLW